MYSMVLCRSNLNDSDYQAIGRLAVVHHATIMSDADSTTIELRTIRVNGIDVSGEERAKEARELLDCLCYRAVRYDPIPENEEG